MESAAPAGRSPAAKVQVEPAVKPVQTQPRLEPAGLNVVSAGTVAVNTIPVESWSPLLSIP